jgi:hypothetical protein
MKTSRMTRPSVNRTATRCPHISNAGTPSSCSRCCPAARSQAACGPHSQDPVTTAFPVRHPCQIPRMHVARSSSTREGNQALQPGIKVRRPPILHPPCQRHAGLRLTPSIRGVRQEFASEIVASLVLSLELGQPFKSPAFGEPHAPTVSDCRTAIPISHRALGGGILMSLPCSLGDQILHRGGSGRLSQGGRPTRPRSRFAPGSDRGWR